MNPNNMRKALTAEDLIRMYDLNNLKKDRKQINITKENIKNQNKLINNFVEATTKGLNELQDQVDGNITTWFFYGVPALENQPSNQWQSKEEKINHLGDLYYDQNTGYAYRFAIEDDIFSWIKITDSDVVKALAMANSAQDTADSKRRIFVTLPTPPYDVGDIWIKEDKELWRCRATRKNGAYSSVDWILATEYTNDDYAKNVEAVLNQFKTNVETNYTTKVQLETTKDSILSSVESTTTKIENRLQNIEELQNTVNSNNELIVPDALEANAIEYKAKGKSEQETTTQSANILEISDKRLSSKANTITYEILTNNSIKTIYAAESSKTYQQVAFVVLGNRLSAGTWYLGGKISQFGSPDGVILNISGYSNGSTTRNFYKEIIFNPSDINVNKYVLLTLTEDDIENNYYKIVFYVNRGSSGETGTNYTTIWEDLYLSKANEYVPFVPNSPSPDYPSEIKSIEGIHNYFKIADSQTKNGITFTKNEDGSFDIIGTSTARTVFSTEYPASELESGQYTLFSNINIPTGVYAVIEQYQDNTWLNVIRSLNSGYRGGTFSTTVTGNKIVCYIAIDNNTTLDLQNAHIQLEKGNKIHGYTPFGKYLLVNNNNENLFDVNDIREVDDNITKAEDGWITVEYNGLTRLTVEKFNYFTNKSKLLKTNTNYAIFLEVKEINGNGYFALTSDDVSTSKGQIDTNTNISFSSLNNNTIYKYVKATRNNFDDCTTMLRTYVQFYSNESGSITFRISVVEDTDLTVEDFEYKPYDQKEILIPLEDNFVGRLDDVKDELEIINNKVILHKKIEKIVLDGTETINRLSSAYSTFRFSVKTNSDNILKVVGMSDINPIMSNKFKVGNRNSTYAQIESICYGSGTSEYGDFNIYCDETKNMTAAEFKTWLSNNPVEVLYQLAEPYDVDLGQVAIPLRQGYNKLTLVEDLETNTEVTYLKDNVLNEEFARQLDLDITNGELNNTKNNLSGLNTEVYNNYQDLLSKVNDKVSNEMITQINQKVEETISSTEWAVNKVEEIIVNGATQVKTGNGMTFNDDGLNFDREGAQVGSSVDEAGMKIVDKTGASNSILQYTGFVTDEIANEVPTLAKSKGSVVNYADRYFFGTHIKGKFGQLEEIEDDELGKGWDFFIGGDE